VLVDVACIAGNSDANRSARNLAILFLHGLSAQPTCHFAPCRRRRRTFASIATHRRTYTARHDLAALIILGPSRPRRRPVSSSSLPPLPHSSSRASLSLLSCSALTIGVVKAREGAATASWHARESRGVIRLPSPLLPPSLWICSGAARRIRDAASRLRQSGRRDDLCHRPCHGPTSAPVAHLGMAYRS
jgi:hypothetical protein